MVGEKKRKENGKIFLFIIFFFFVLKKIKICSPLLRVTTNHLYTLGKCRFTWRLMILCACSDFFFPALSPASFPSWKCLWEIINFFWFYSVSESYLGPRTVKMNYWRSQSTVGNPSRWRETVGLFFFSNVYILFFCSSVPNMVLEMYFMLFNYSIFHVNLVTVC